MARRLICPKCAAQYEIDASLIPAEGREVECSSCEHVWHEPGAENTGEEPRLHRPLDASILSILRGEAEREIAARQAEREGKPVAAVLSQLRDDVPHKLADDDAPPLKKDVAKKPRPEVQAEPEPEPESGPKDVPPPSVSEQPEAEAPARKAPSEAAPPVLQTAPSEPTRASKPKHLPDAESLAATLIAPLPAVVPELAADEDPPARSASGRGFCTALLLAAAFFGVYLSAPYLADQGRAGEMLAEWRLDVDRGRVWLYGHARETLEGLRAMLR